MPVPLDATNRRANQLVQTWASEGAWRRGVDNRAFMVSACGPASTLLALNVANEMANLLAEEKMAFHCRTFDEGLEIEAESREN